MLQRRNCNKKYVNTLQNEQISDKQNYRISIMTNHSFRVKNYGKANSEKRRLFNQSLDKLTKIKHLALIEQQIKAKLKIQRQQLQKRKDKQVQIIEQLKINSHNQFYLVKIYKNPQIYFMKKVQLDDMMVQRQIQLLKKMKSPYIIKFIHSFQTHECNKNYANIITERYPYNLQEIIKTANIDSITFKLYSYQILRAVAYIHSKNICHRDIKPNNFLIYKKKIVMCDFGSAKNLGTNSKSISYVGSRYYRAPQLILGAQKYDLSIDIWSVACTLAEMLVKKPIFKGCNNIDQLIKILEILGTPNWRSLTPQINPPKLPKFIGQSIQALLPRQTDEQFIDLLKRMLKLQPKNRISALDALIHPFFDQIRQQQFNSNILQKFGELGSLLNFQKEQLNNKQQYYSLLVPLWRRNRDKK